MFIKGTKQFNKLNLIIIVKLSDNKSWSIRASNKYNVI